MTDAASAHRAAVGHLAWLRNNSLLARLIKFSIVGVINTLLHLVFFYFLMKVEVHYLLSQVTAFVLVNIVTFTINKYWTFQDRSRRVGLQLVLYYAGRIFTLGVTLVQTYVMVRFYGISPFVCQVSAVLINFTFNFFIAQILVFRGELLPLEHFVEKSFRDLARVESETQKNVVVVVPIFKEHHRLFPKTTDNPLGEDSLRLKIEQLESLFRERPDFRWKLLFTDDGDFEYQSGRRLLEHLKQAYPAYLEDGRIEVRFLEEMKPGWARESQKGGSVIAAFREVELNDDDIILYTDADKSNDLRLAGTLIKPIASDGFPVVITSRWLQESTVVNRGVTAKLSSFIYNVFVFLFLGLSYTDTQNGFKAFRFEAARRIVEHCRDIRFSFDTEMLMIASVLGYPVVEVPTYYDDSVEESTVNLKRDAWRMVAALNAQRRLKRRLKRALKRALAAR